MNFPRVVTPFRAALEAEPDAAEEAGLADVLAGHERYDLRRRVAGVIDELGDLLALRDRCGERAFVADLHLSSSAGDEPGGNRHREVARRDQRHFAASFPAGPLRVPTLAPAWNKGLACHAPKPHSISRFDSCTRAFQLAGRRRPRSGGVRSVRPSR